MRNFQIKVVNAHKSAEIQEKLFKLGFYWCASVNYIHSLEDNSNYITAKEGEFLSWSYRDSRIQEITLSQLDEMFISHKEAEILKRGNIQDATHVNDITGFKYLLLKHTRHEWRGNHWALTDIDFSKLKPIDALSSCEGKSKGFDTSDFINVDEAKKLWANGVSLLVSITGENWHDLDRSYSLDVFDGEYYFKLKPKFITINNINFPEPLSIEPDMDSECWIVAPAADCLAYSLVWSSTPYEKEWLKRGLLHSSKDNAIAHAKALIAASGGCI